MSDLSGVTVVVTRPTHQADNLCRRIEASGGTALRFPVIEIAPPQDPQKCQSRLAHLPEADLAIFVSANAVNAALALQASWPDDLAIAAVGKATAQALNAKQLQVTHIAPEPYNSEALLGLPELQDVTAKRIIIFRGNGGRELLRNRLLERGAEVEYVECYQRVKPQTDRTALYAAWDEKKVMPFVVTSNQSLKNLQSMIEQAYQAKLLASPLILISERSAALSVKMGFTQPPIIAAAANDEAIFTALTHWANG